MYIPAAPSLSPLALVRALYLQAAPPPREDRVYASYGRYCLRMLADAAARLGVKELLAPAYICREALEPVMAGPLRVRFYDVRPDLAPDLEKLAPAPSGSAALLLVHYFGFPNAVEEVTGFCREKDFRLIEDCAQALFSMDNGKPLGSFGDAAFFSPRKFLPIPHGAYTVINHPELKKALLQPSGDAPSPGPTLGRDLARWVLFQSGTNLGLGDGDDHLLPEARPWRRLDVPPAISGLARQMLSRQEQDRESVIIRRRRNYEQLSQELAPLPLKPLFPDLPTGVCPLAFPVIPPNRDEVLQRLRRAGIGAQFWPALPDEVFNNPHFPEANRLRRQLLLLPVHQDLSSRHLAHLSCSLAKALQP